MPSDSHTSSSTVERLRQFTIFSDAGSDELAKISSRTAVLHRAAGSVLVAEGAPGNEVFVILGGSATVTRRGESLATLGPGDLFGEMAALDGGVRTATVTAVTSVELLLIEPDSLAEIVPAGTLVHKMLRTLSERLRLVQELPDWSVGIEKAASYTLGAEAPELERLLVQARGWAPVAITLLDRLGLVPGSQALDVACGPLGIMDLLAERVGRAGSVTGIDREPRMIEMAREVAAERGLPVTLAVADAAATDLPAGSFDLVHARALLINIVNVAGILAEMIRLTRPGGVVACQEPDGEVWTCDPPHPAWEQIRSALQITYRLQQRDWKMGRTLSRRLRHAGLEDVHAEMLVLRTRSGDPLQKNLLGVFAAARPLVLEAGVFDEATIDGLSAALNSHLDDPETTTNFTMGQAWGRRPI